MYKENATKAIAKKTLFIQEGLSPSDSERQRRIKRGAERDTSHHPAKLLLHGYEHRHYRHQPAKVRSYQPGVRTPQHLRRMGHNGTHTILTMRESEVAERIAWGASQRKWPLNWAYPAIRWTTFCARFMTNCTSVKSTSCLPGGSVPLSGLASTSHR